MPRKPRPTPPPAVTTTWGEVTHIQPVDPAHTTTHARLLLTAATTPGEVATTTTPTGWRVPTSVARKAGYLPRKRGR